MDFFGADFHFNHTNIIKYCNRPFSSLEEMNQTLIDNWNKKVTNKDTVYVIGDFCLGRASDYGSIRKQLNGNIVLITGDHDKIIRNAPDFNLKLKTPYFEFKKNKHKIILFHWCIRSWAKSHFNSWHLYGHSHGKLLPIGKSWDVGVDNNNYELLSYDEIVDIMKNRPDNPNLILNKKIY